MGGSSFAIISQAPPRTSCKDSSKPPSHRRTTPVPRFKRETHPLPAAQDRLFSDWKVLVGPTDWQNHAAGVEGAERYRLHNLPCYFGPGVYELGLCQLAEWSSHGTRSARQPSKYNTVIVYVGKAENVRMRLQHYGRCGSHLEGGTDLPCATTSGQTQQAETLNSSFTENKPDPAQAISDSFNAFPTKENTCCPSLFTDAFSRGYSIVYRWTAVKSKGSAQALETGLLKLFDYAWNRGNNGERRPSDAFVKMHEHESMHYTCKGLKSQKCGKVFKWPIAQIVTGNFGTRGLQGKRSSITVLKNKLKKLYKKPINTSTSDNVSPFYMELEALPWKEQLKEEHAPSTSRKNKLCGMVDNQGLICTNAPNQGRKRCGVHKGMRLSSVRPATTVVKGDITALIHTSGSGLKEVMKDPELLIHCGYLLENGLRCMVVPERGRKRCTLHKGKRIQSVEI